MAGDVTRWLAARAIPLDGLAPGSGTADLEPLRAVLDGVRVAGLGEATHGSREFFLLKHRLLEFLVEELGFTTLAFEVSASAARAVDDYVRGGPGDPVEALAGLGFWITHTAEMLAVVEWLRERNARLRERGAGASRPVRFAGIDPQYPGASLEALRAFLDEAGQGRELLEPLLPLAHTRLGEGEPLDGGVEQAARRLEEHLAGLRAPGDVLEHARLVRQNVDLMSRPLRHADPARTVSLARDRYLADNVDVLLSDPGARVAVWAHNGHVTRAAHSGGAIPAMGRHLAERHGEAYYALGVLFGEGAFRARRPRFGRIDRRRPPATLRVPPARNDLVVETRLAAAHPGDFLVDLRHGPHPEPVRAWLRGRSHLRAYGGMVKGLTYKLAFTRAVLAEEFDGLAFVARSTCSTPL
ncbi:erythromycin esterase [Thermocatellispora tengchongensis]|uniref:Erythromycin esterase n=1 Tax=Thermocatellispora tengchongensis TaxID=1073253 RepID=A0A840P618_9ACTN|nr:erythromycin esterase family protein [Thermocatellispora tengchongensis]MBB5136774.1 erythromycin esterase [Thermocatellispora tengchongensis]